MSFIQLRQSHPLSNTSAGNVLPFVTIIVLISTLFVGRFDSEASAKPNILFLMSDDHAAQAFGVYKSRLAKLNPTPNIDQLARDGMVLENAFCTNSICTPSRASIMTGQYSQTNGVLNLSGRLPIEKQYLAQEMKKAGYLTAIIGKWHLKEEPGAFDYYHVLPGQGSYFDPTFRDKGHGHWPDNVVEHSGHSSDVITDISLEWLKNRDKTKPFFLMHHFKAPHGKWENAPRYNDYLADITIPVPESLFTQPKFGSIATRGENDSLLGRIGSSISRRNVNNIMGRITRSPVLKPHDTFDTLTDDDYTNAAYQLYLKRYLRCVKGVDDNVQRLIDYLKNEDLLENTIVIYTSDQGMMLGEHDYIDKRWMYEESMRMPLIVRYPRTIAAGTRSDAIVNNTDFAPTLLDYAGLSTPQYMQGRSFRSILETGSEPDDWPQATYYRYWMHMVSHANPGHFGIRTKDFKLIFYYGCNTKGKNRTPPGWELYDMKNDPHELHNIYSEPKYKKIVGQLKSELLALRKTLNETDGNFSDIQKIIEENWN